MIASWRSLLGPSALVVSMAAGFGCGGSEVPEAPPGVPMNPPQEDPTLAAMMESGPSTPSTATPSAEDQKKAEDAKKAEEAKAAEDAKKAEEAKAAEDAKKKGGKAPKPKDPKVAKDPAPAGSGAPSSAPPKTAPSGTPAK